MGIWKFPLSFGRKQSCRNFADEILEIEDQTSSEEEITFITIVLIIVVAWILVVLWTRFIENFAFGTLRLDGNSTWHARIVAIVATVFFFALVWMIDSYDFVSGDIIQSVEDLF
jgi:hypothetical protein